MRHIAEQDLEAAAGSSADNVMEEAALPVDDVNETVDVSDLSLSKDEENEQDFINWAAVFSGKFKENSLRNGKIFCPGYRPPPKHPKLSKLTGAQHFQCLKVLCAKYPHILQAHLYPLPTHLDEQCLQALTTIYEIEQKEFQEWAKSQWASHYCARVLKTKPELEKIYDTEFKRRARRVNCYPKLFNEFTQVPLVKNCAHKFSVVLENTLIDAKPSDMPMVDLPELIHNISIFDTSAFYSITTITNHTKCQKHPLNFTVPNDPQIPMRSITDIHRELANYAAKNSSKFIASENALRCLVTLDRHWTIPITVSSAQSPEGKDANVMVLDSEFFIHKEPVMIRNYRAFRHLTQYALIPLHMQDINTYQNEEESTMTDQTDLIGVFTDDAEAVSDEQELLKLFAFKDHNDEPTRNTVKWDPSLPLGQLTFKDDEGDTNKKEETTEQKINLKYVEEVTASSSSKTCGDQSMSCEDTIDEGECTCTSTSLPQRSFKKLGIWNETKNEGYNLIVHCSHKARLNSNEVVLDVIPEYQLELGGSELSPDKVRSLALALMLRDNPSALNVRIDGSNGNIVTYETISVEQFMDKHEEESHQMLNAIHTVLAELEMLPLGHYVLKHDPSRGAHAYLYRASPKGTDFVLEFNSSKIDEDEDRLAKNPPIISPVLLPFHKHHKILPCAFTPYKYQVQKPPAKKKTSQQKKSSSKKRSKRRK